MFATAETEIKYADGFLTAPRSNHAFSLFDLAARSAPATLSATAELSHRIPAHPTGCAVCELEVDPQTGLVEIKRYTSVDDVGAPINPMLVDGQMHGGIVQGIGQALSEGVATDPGSGAGHQCLLHGLRPAAGRQPATLRRGARARPDRRQSARH
jgi:carbon-monoxide dehydrogenase large subunit